MLSLNANFFEKSYEHRTKLLAYIALTLLIMYRIILVFESAKGIHGINLFNITQIFTIYTVISFFLILLMSFRMENSGFKNFIIITILVFQMFFAGLYLFQFILARNPLVIQSDDVFLIFFQLITFLFILILDLSRKNQARSIKKYKLPLPRILIILGTLSFLIFFLSKIISSSFSLLLLFIASLVVLSLLWIIIIEYFKLSRTFNKKFYGILAVVAGIFIGLGMAIGMTRREVLTAVISSIQENLLSLKVINSNLDLLQINPEFILILVNSITIFVFFFLFVLTLIFSSRSKKKTVVSYALIGMAGLGVTPILSISRLLGLILLITEEKD